MDGRQPGVCLETESWEAFVLRKEMGTPGNKRCWVQCNTVAQNFERNKANELRAL
jgi:hypothetical protein